MINICVTGTGSLIGQAIIKCIQSSKYKDTCQIIGCDYFTNTVGSYWSTSNYILPDIYKKTENVHSWLEEIKKIIIKHDIRFLFIGVDFELPLFATFKKELENETNVIILVSSSQVIEIGNDKYKTFQFLKENKLPFPKTQYYSDCIPENIDYPVILKPAIGARSRDVYLTHDKEEIISKAKNIDRPIVQEMIGTDSDEYTCGVLMLDNRYISSIVLRRTLKDGNTAKAYFSFDFPGAINDYVKRITQKLQPFGACNLQLRIDKNGIPKLFEINPRHSGTTFMRTKFGYNEVEMILDYFLKNKIDQPVLREGVVIRYFTEMFQKLDD